MNSSLYGNLFLIIFLLSASESFSNYNISKGSSTGNDPFSFDSLKLNDGTDPSQPLSRIDLQNDFFWDWLEYKNDRSFNITQLNGGKTFFNSKLYFFLRIPLVTTNLTFENQTGFGDVSLTFNIQPIIKINSIYSQALNLFFQLNLQMKQASENLSPDHMPVSLIILNRDITD